MALVEGARQLGFEFRGRTRTHLTVSFFGREVRCRSDARSCLAACAAVAAYFLLPSKRSASSRVNLRTIAQVCQLLWSIYGAQNTVQQDTVVRGWSYPLLLSSNRRYAAREQVVHRVLVELEFTSERARASVVFQAPDGTIRLMCKGSDAVMLPRIRDGSDPALLAETDRNLHAFSVKGLRTLVLATKVRTASDKWSVAALCVEYSMHLHTATLTHREQGRNGRLNLGVRSTL